MTRVNYAKLLAELGCEREALPLFDAASTAAKNRGDTNGTIKVDLLSAPAWCQLGQLDECESRLRRSEDALRRQYPPGNPMLGTQATEWAQLAVARGKPAEARQYLHAALKIFSGTRERNPNELRAMALLTEVDLSLGDTSAADADAATAVEKAEAALGGFTHSAWLGRALEVQAEVLRAEGRMDAARTAFGQALDMLQLTVGAAAPWTKQAQAALAGVNP